MPAHKLNEFLLRLVRHESLSRDEATMLLDAMLDGDATDAQISAVLVALASKGETVAELAGLASALRSRSVRLQSQHRCFIDTAGTGSSRAKTFNVSTAAAFVIAAAGLPVAKHGNRAASSKSGSADVLTELGVNVGALPNVSEAALNDIGICFMFAPLYHGATARVAAIRRELGIHTSFNLLGPLSNPAGAPRQIIGVFRSDLVEHLARVLAELGTEHSWVVHGSDGLDEITITGKTFVAEARNDQVRTFEIGPEEFGLSQGSLEHLRGGDAAGNAKIIRQVFSRTRDDEARSLVIMTAAAALMLGGKSPTLEAAARLAADAIDSGAANAKLELLIKATNG